MRTTHVAVRKWCDVPPSPAIVDLARARLAQRGQPESPRRPIRNRRDDGGGDAGQT
ncbi:hypothetical protein [Sorangium sp. So ce854]|uniref:hypothetical protein n=1 Tax=Sorangium sp. So ce854 TaxID=3133322 RepID=UPI003F5D5D1D